MRIDQERGLKYDNKDIFGLTPYSFALFNKNLEICQLLSKQKPDEIIQDPRWGKQHFSHTRLTYNMFSYLKNKYGYSGEKSNGVCNGWSFQAALAASESTKLIEQHYAISELISNWNGRQDLNTPPPEYLNEYQTLDEAFRVFTQEVLYFYQQRMFSIDLPMSDRVKQVELVSDKRGLLALTDFSLPDLTLTEQLEILKAYQTLSDDMIIDVRSLEHAVAYYQKTAQEIFYFDPNIPYPLEPFADYGKVLGAISAKMQGNVGAFSCYHAHPNIDMTGIIEKANSITNRLIDTLILQNPNRMKKICEILSTCAEQNTPIFLEALLKQKPVQQALTADILLSCAKKATSNSRCNYQILLVLFKNGFGREQLQALSKDPMNISLIHDFLKTSILYEDRALYEIVPPILKDLIPKYLDLGTRPDIRAGSQQTINTVFLPSLRFRPSFLDEQRSDQKSTQPEKKSERPRK